MTKDQFLSELERKLKHLPADERADAVEFYREYFEEAGVENEQRVIAELKSPSHIASKILAEFAEKEMTAGKQAQKAQKQSFSNGVWFTVLALCAAPIALPFLFAIVLIVFVLFVVLASFLVAFLCIAAALVITAFYIFFGFPLAAGFLFGGALISAGIAVLLVLMIKNLASFIVKKLARK